MAEQQKACKHNGCRKKYLESENTEGICLYHPGKPIFHDTKKGWTCCNKIVYDWDEFQKLPHCQTGKHTDVEDHKDEFFKSSTVQNASNALKKQQGKGIVVKSIDDYNKQQEEKKKKLEAQAAQKTKQIVVKDGKYRCTNKGCNKDYVPEQNTETICGYHPGNPIFHDLKKGWTCCNKIVYDWDEFQKLPTCAVGAHIPKCA